MLSDQQIQQKNICPVSLRYKQCNAPMHSFDFGGSGGGEKRHLQDRAKCPQVLPLIIMAQKHEKE